MYAGAESYLWPDLSLADQYPDIPGKKYLCSGMMMGYAETFWAILNYKVGNESKNLHDVSLRINKNEFPFLISLVDILC